MLPAPLAAVGGGCQCRTVVSAYLNRGVGLLARSRPLQEASFQRIGAFSHFLMTTGQAAALPPHPRTTRRRPSLVTAAPAPPERPRKFPPGFARRPTLVQRLVEADDVSAVVILAPPGYGKSSLLSEWGETDRRPFVSLSSTSEDSLISSLAQARRHERGSVLLLDDAHLAPAEVLHRLMAMATTELPTGTLLALAARGEPQLPLGALRARRELIELGARDLALSSAQASILLRGMGVELQPDELDTLVRRTEGWPAALYLAALAMRGHPEIPPGLPPIGASSHLLAAYLRDDVLSTLPPGMTAFATQASVLDELSGPACDAVLERHDSAAKLAELARITRLLVPLDWQHARFRWHHLFREMLAGELRRDAPGLDAKLHGRAAVWYRGRGEVTVAIEHMVAMGEAEQSGDLLLAQLPRLLGAGRAQLVARWLGRFSQGQVASHASLAVCAAHSSLAAGDIAGAEQWALNARMVLSDEPGSCEPNKIATALAVIEATVARAGAAKMGQIATEAFDSEPAGSAWRPALAFLRGASSHLTGDRAFAGELLEMGAALGAAAAPSISSLCLAQHAMMSIECGDWEMAADVAERAMKLVKQHGLAACPVSALVFAASAATRAHERCVDEAKRNLRAAADLLVSLGDFASWYGAQARILLAHASLCLADAVGARTLLAEASRLARRMPDAIIFERWFDGAWDYLDTLAESSLAGPSALTIAELRILRFLPSHRSFREIASQLGVSANTVKTQAHAIYRKLGVASRSEAVERAQQAGLLGQ